MLCESNKRYMIHSPHVCGIARLAESLWNGDQCRSMEPLVYSVCGAMFHMIFDILAPWYLLRYVSLDIYFVCNTFSWETQERQDKLLDFATGKTGSWILHRPFEAGRYRATGCLLISCYFDTIFLYLLFNNIAVTGTHSFKEQTMNKEVNVLCQCVNGFGKLGRYG